MTAPVTCEAFTTRPRTIVLRLGMPDRAVVPTFMHEMEHAARDDDGPQPAAVESRINRIVAHRLVSIAEYSAAERVAGPGAGALAVGLEVLTWVIMAFQRSLRPTRPSALPSANHHPNRDHLPPPNPTASA